MATSTTKSGAKKSAATKKKATKKKASAATTKKAAAEKEPVKKKAAATKTAAKKAPAKKASAKKASAKKAPAKKAPAKKAAKEATPKAPKLTAPPKPPKTPFDKKFLDEVRTLLLEERARYVKSADTLKAEADSLVEGREPGDVQFDEESGEGDTLAVERERDLALSAAARAAVQEIDDALARIDAGTYGVCTGSGKPIPKERLRAIPWATQRVEVKAGGFGIR